MSGKNFSDLNLDFDDVDGEVAQPSQSRPRNIKEQHRAAKRAERGPLKNQTYTLAEKVTDELRKHVLTRKLKGEKISASRIVEEAIKAYLKN